MNWKKGFFAFILFALCTLSPVFATNGSVTLNGEITKVVKIIAAVVIAVSVMMIIFGGMKYVTSQGDPRATENAKLQIMYAGFGVFLAMIATMVASIMGTMTEIEVEATDSEEGPPGFVIGIFVFVLMGIVGSVLYSMFKEEEEEDTSTDTKEEVAKTPTTKSTVRVDTKEHQAFENYLLSNSFSFKQDLSKIHGENKAFAISFRPYDHELKSQISFLFNETSYMYSTLDTKTYEHAVTLNEEIEFIGDTYEMTRSISAVHHHLVQLYYEQHFTSKQWIDYLVESINSRIVKEKVAKLIPQYEIILSYHQQLNTEQRYFLEESFLHDIENILKPYGKLSDSKQISLETSLIERLSMVEKQLNDIELSISTQLERDVEHAFRVIDQKYQEKK